MNRDTPIITIAGHRMVGWVEVEDSHDLPASTEVRGRSRPAGLPGITKMAQAEQWSFWACGDSGFAEWPTDDAHAAFRARVEAWGDHAARHGGTFPDGTRVPADWPQPTTEALRAKGETE